MTSSSPSDPLFALKGEARRLRAEALTLGEALTHSAALERVAQRKGFRSWNALSAHVAEGGALNPVARAYCWEQLAEPLPQLPMRIISSAQQSRHKSITELMRWARQLELIATNVAEEGRSEMVELIGNRTPYVVEKSKSRWDDGLYHLCDRGYDEFKGVAFTQDQVDSLGLDAWNEAYGSHGGNDTFTIIGDDWRYTKKADMLRRMARLIAAMAIEADKGLHAQNVAASQSAVVPES